MRYKIHHITIVFILSISYAIQTNGQKVNDQEAETFHALALTSAFDLPIVRFNRLNSPGANNENGNVEFFNSVGAGIGFKFGQIKEFKNTENESVSEFSNIVGLSGGVLFSSSSVDENTRDNVFAPTIGISILDLKIAVGWELGDRPEGVERRFFTVAYGIPISKLTSKTGIILKNFSNRGKTKVSFF